MTIDLSIILAAVCVLTGIASFFCGRSSTKSKEVNILIAESKVQGEKDGRIEAKIDNVAVTLAKLEASLVDYRKEFNDKIIAVHKRLDKHIEGNHGGNNG